MVFNYRNCIEQGLLRRIPPSKDKTSRSVKKAEKWLEAKKTLKSKAFDSSVLGSYMVMFHSARAILFFDGYREKSHSLVISERKRNTNFRETKKAGAWSIGKT